MPIHMHKHRHVHRTEIKQMAILITLQSHNEMMIKYKYYYSGEQYAAFAMVSIYADKLFCSVVNL